VWRPASSWPQGWNRQNPPSSAWARNPETSR
jgi:hypothetical protein